MTELIAVVIILGAFVYWVNANDRVKETHKVMVPRNIQRGAQHAADESQKSQVVSFDGSTFHIIKADNQHAARGEIMMVFHPSREPEQREIYVGAVLKPRGLGYEH